MRNCLALFIAMVVTAAMGQGVGVTESPKRPGDPLRYTITLDKAVKGTVNVIYVSFRMTSPPRENQRGLPNSFQLSKFKQVSPTEYSIDDVVPAAMSGTYLLESIQFRTEGAIGNYGYPQDFKQENTIRIETQENNIFPSIKSVQPSQ